jgi:hypothetical protein
VGNGLDTMVKYLRRTTSVLNFLVLEDSGSIYLNANKIEPSMLAMLPTAVLRLLIDASVSQRRRCLFPSSASHRSGFVPHAQAA